MGEINNVTIFHVKITTREDILGYFDRINDISAIHVFSYNSFRDTSWMEIFIVYFLFVISSIFTFVGVRCSLQSTFPHVYQRSIYIFALIAWCELIVSRSLVFYFQLTKDPTQLYSKSLYFAGLFRYHYMFVGAHIIFCTVFERVMATYYWRDYEKTQRIWIVWMVLIFANVLSLILSFLTVHAYIHMRFICVYGFTFTIAGMIILEILYALNRHKLNALDRNDKRVSYSLTIRYQIQENVRSIRIIRSLVITVGLFILGIISGECLPILIDLDDNYLHLCNIIFDTMVNSNPIFVIPLSFLVYDDLRKIFWRKYAKHLSNSTSSLAHKKFSLSEHNTTQAGDTYFEMFNRSVKFDRTENSK